MKNAVFAVLGGDLRLLRAAEMLRKSGFQVFVFGFSADRTTRKDIVCCDTVETALQNASYILLPLPCSVDGIHLYAPFWNEPISLQVLYEKIPITATVLGGSRYAEPLQARGICVLDYAQRDDFQIANAVPTAEGAIQLAMEKRPITIHGSRCLVVGFGRIGKVLADLLSGLHGDVTVSARKYADLVSIRNCGYHSIRTASIAENADRFDFIFNTVPAMVFDATVLCRMRPDSLLIDLASKPGGVDFDAAAEMGIEAIHALALPGKVAPQTAGDMIQETVLNILEGGGSA